MVAPIAGHLRSSDLSPVDDKSTEVEMDPTSSLFNRGLNGVLNRRAVFAQSSDLSPIDDKSTEVEMDPTSSRLIRSQLFAELSRL